MTNPLPSPETLRNLLRYDPQTGYLFWRERGVEWFCHGRYTADRSCRSWNAQYAGARAFTASDGGGYRQGTVLGRKVLAHRVVWAIVKGVWPDQTIDHINGLKNDNRIANLRDVSSVDNGRNQRLSRASTSGVAGVWWSKKRKKWWASIKVDQKSIYLGEYGDISSAVIARKTAERKYGFHENHGKR